MNIKQKVLTLSMILVFVSSQSQNFSGVASYKSKKNSQMKLDTVKYDAKTRAQLSGFFAAAFEKDYVLKFNKTSSRYEQEEVAGAKLGKTVRAGSSSSDVLFKDLKNKTFVHRKELLGKLFSVQDALISFQWFMTSETKQIGEYTCHKAISRASDNPWQKEIVAWFSTDIPVSSGPSLYGGLPGLILQVNDGTYTVVCTSINLSDQTLNLSAPKRGKKIGRLEYEALEQAKIKNSKTRAKAMMNSMESERGGY